MKHTNATMPFLYVVMWKKGSFLDSFTETDSQLRWGKGISQHVNLLILNIYYYIKPEAISAVIEALPGFWFPIFVRAGFYFTKNVFTIA